ncbi:MAG: hypothetical protein HZC11_05005 [Nitrospirae bacterium]|nr:hypothetical protein [Nitrospirota bacterium]
MILKINIIKTELIKDVIIHAVLMTVALILSYNTYKEYVRGYNNVFIFPAELKIAIKATFPWTIIIFISLFVIYKTGKKNGYLSALQYIGIFIFQAIIINLVFISKGAPVLIVQNLALFYFVIFLLIWGVMKRLIDIDKTGWAEEILPPTHYRSLQTNMPIIRQYFKIISLSRRFAISFMMLFAICAFLLMVGAHKIAEQLANVAYFLLIIAVGIETYKLIKYGERDEKE